MKENKHYVRGSHVKGNYKYAPKGLSGVYFITHDKTGHFYIGQSSDIGTRLSHHFGNLRKGTNPCKNLQELYNNSNYEDFSFDYIILDTEDERKKLELELLNKFDGSDLILNSATKNNSWVLNESNKEQTEEWKATLSEIAKSRTGEKNPFFNKNHTQETKEKISKAHKGKTNESCWKGVVINGVFYKNLDEASEKLNVHITTISHRVRSENNLFVNWYSFEDVGEIKVFDDRLMFPPNSKPSGLYSIEGQLYIYKKDIFEKFNVKSSTFTYRLNSNNFPEWVKLI